MYREPRRLASILKCRFCRRDKRRCIPENRVWPGQKCEACERYGYDCSVGLSADQEKADTHRRQANRRHKVVHRSGPSQSSSTNTHPGNGGAIALRPAPQRHAHGGQHTSADPHSLTLCIEPRATRRMEFAGRLDLEERLLRLWANPETYQTACSLRLATTTAELFTHLRRVAETDDLIFSSLFAFIAGNLSVYAERQIALQLETLSRRYLGRTFRLLKDYMDQAFPAGIPRLGTILPMQYACFLLASYGSSTNEPQMIDLMVKLLECLRQYSASFPLRLGFVPHEPDGWSLRIYMADDPSARAIEIGHNTKVFKQAMIQANDEVFPASSQNDELVGSSGSTPPVEMA